MSANIHHHLEIMNRKTYQHSQIKRKKQEMVHLKQFV